MSDMPSREPRQIVATVRTESSRNNFWDILERVVNALALIAIPIVLWVLTARTQFQTADIAHKQQVQLAEISSREQTQLAEIAARQQSQLAQAGASQQAQLAEGAARLEYLKIAVSILAQPIPENPQQPHLRDWAVNVLANYSPRDVPLGNEEQKGLRSGRITLPCDTCYPRVTIDKVAAIPSVAAVGDPVTFEVTVSGGDDRYVIMWYINAAIVGDNIWYRTRFDTPGEKVATVRVVSNGQSVSAQISVQIIKK